jgi:hypothetical protein
MKKRASISGLVLLLLLALSGFVLGGCATNSNDLDHVSERPWNQPVGWENGLPSSMSEGR